MDAANAFHESWQSLNHKHMWRKEVPVLPSHVLCISHSVFPYADNSNILWDSVVSGKKGKGLYFQIST